MRAVHLVAALAASCLTGLAADAHAQAWIGGGGRYSGACGSGYHPDQSGNCQPDIAQANRYCPEGAVYHPWNNGGWYCEYPEAELQPQPRPQPHRVVRDRERPRAAHRAPAAARPTDQTRSIVAPAEASSVPIQPGFVNRPIFSGGGGGGGGGGGWSDRRLKRDIVRLGVSPSGLPIYAFRYVWGGPRYIGVMAQDLLKLRPDAVILDESGYYKVDYSRIDVEMREESLAA
jgi:hypothetical protein